MPGERWLQPRFPAQLHKLGWAGKLSACQRTLSCEEHRSRLIETAVTPHLPQPPPTWPLAVPDAPACGGQGGCGQACERQRSGPELGWAAGAGWGVSKTPLAGGSVRCPWLGDRGRESCCPCPPCMGLPRTYPQPCGSCHLGGQEGTPSPGDVPSLILALPSSLHDLGAFVQWVGTRKAHPATEQRRLWETTTAAHPLSSSQAARGRLLLPHREHRG